MDETPTVAHRVWSIARLFFAGLTLTAVVVQGADLASRDLPLTNFFSYFTIQSNLFAGTILTIAALRCLAGRSIEPLSMVRGAATFYMVVTGFVYSLLLRNVDVQTSEPWINIVLHYVMPVVLLVDWAVFAPEARIAFRRALIWLVYPVAYVAYSLIRGTLVDWYPYPFLDPREDGYLTVAITSAAILVFGTVLIAVLIRATGRR